MRYDKFIVSDSWKVMRNEILEERGCFCERCGDEFPRGELRIHHRHYDKEFGFEGDEDLMVVCVGCHYVLHKDCLD